MPAFFAMMLALSLAWGTAPAADGYHLGVGDRLSIRVYERADISGEYDVRTPGSVSIPTLGTIAVAGRSPTEVEIVVANRLGLRSVGETSLVSIEVLKFRSIYVLGNVRRPGAYEYVPGLFVLQAISIAGGYRQFDDESFAVRSEIARSKERLLQTREAIGVNLAWAARLEAESREAQTIDFPQELERYLSPERRDRVMANERRTFALRSETLANSLRALRGSRSVFEEEIRGYSQRIAAADTQIKLIRAEIEEVTRGQVAPKTFILALRRLVASLEGEKGERLAFIARAHQQIATLDQEIARIPGARRAEVSIDLKVVEDELARLRISMNEIRRFLAGANLLLDAAGSRRASKEARAGDAIIVRRTSTGLTQFSAGPLDEVAPGDVITIPMQVE